MSNFTKRFESSRLFNSNRLKLGNINAITLKVFKLFNIYRSHQFTLRNLSAVTFGNAVYWNYYYIFTLC